MATRRRNGLMPKHVNVASSGWGFMRHLCRASGGATELDLGSVKPFDEFHLSAAVRTLPEGQIMGLAWCRLAIATGTCGFQQLGAQW